MSENVNKNLETKEKEEEFDYKHKASFKVSEKFKQTFNTKVAGGRETISADGLVALAHIKGIWKMETEILQYPNAENGNVCICKAIVGGYDWDPTENKIVKVEYSDIGDASPMNCNKNVAPHFIRMASTRATGRALRKYTNLDMLCTEELGDDDVSTQSGLGMINENITMDQLMNIKNITMQKKIDQATFMDILKKTFNTEDFQSLTVQQGNQFIEILTNYVTA